MGNVVNKKFNTGIITFTFTNEDDEVFSKFKMNPTDVNLMKRAEEVSEYFSARKNKVEDSVSGADLSKYNDEIEEKINYLLGYDARKDIFGEITATTVSPEGDIFAFVLMDFIIEKLRPEIEKRNENMQSAVAKYTDKYKK